MSKSKERKTVDTDFLRDYLICRIELWCEYHNHKETMANAGLLVQISLFGTVLTETILPPNWLKSVTDFSHLFSFLTYAVLWSLIHVYMRWQLTNKRIAAIYVSNFEWAIRRFAMSQLSEQDLEARKESPNQVKTWKDKLKSQVKSILNGMIYIPGAYFRMDANTDYLPEFLATKIDDDQRRGATGASFLEALMTYVSWALLLIIGFKIFTLET